MTDDDKLYELHERICEHRVAFEQAVDAELDALPDEAIVGYRDFLSAQKPSHFASAMILACTATLGRRYAVRRAAELNADVYCYAHDCDFKSCSELHDLDDETAPSEPTKG